MPAVSQPYTPVQLVENARALVPLLREHADEIDELGVLPRSVVTAMDAAGMFSIGIPGSHGGPAPVPVRQRTEVLMELGRGTAAAPWAVWADLPTSEYLHHFGEQTVAEVLATEHVGPLTGGSAFNLGTAVGIGTPTDGGMLLRGSWTFCSNARLAAWIFVGFTWTDESGAEQNSVALVPRKDFRVSDNWNVTAMQGSGSNSVYIEEDVFVPEYRIKPFMSGTEEEGLRVGATIMLDFAAITVGLALAALEVFTEKVAKRAPWGMPYAKMSEMPVVQSLVGRATTRINVGRTTLLADAQRVDDHLDSALVTTCGYDCIHIAHEMREVAEELRNVMGTSALSVGDPLGRCARDATALCLHGAVRQWSQESHGRLILGVEPPGEMSLSTLLGPGSLPKHTELIETDPRTRW
ncbi:MAG TPA: acyl-CoA dehydrogenase family protein [Baekduia sp.]|nr:acyl-CoA dehydrogenase family protein [Baekduia sp.]